MSQPKKIMPKKETTKKVMPKKELPKKSVAKEAGKKDSVQKKTSTAPKSKTAPKPQSQAPKHTITAKLQYAGKAIPISDIFTRAKDACGNGDVNIYIKPEESRVYYVSGDVIGSFEI